jgi:hypothetical protein
MKRLLVITVLCVCLAISALVNAWLFVGRYYVGKTDHALLVELHRTYQSQGCRLPDDIENRFDLLVRSGFQDLGEMNNLSMELQRKSKGDGASGEEKTRP